MMTPNRKLALLIIVFTISATTLFSQNRASFHFRTIQVDDGLSENAAYCILQDQQGYIWIGTKDGLNRFDGQEFKIYRKSENPNSLGNNFVRSIAEYNHNTLFIGTDAGLYIMNTTEGLFNQLEYDNSTNKINTAINSVIVDTDSLAWFGTMDGRVFTYNHKENKVTLLTVAGTGLRNSAVWNIYEDKTSQIWIGSRQGLLRYSYTRNQLEPIDNLFSTSTHSDYSNEILSIYEDIDGYLWLGTWANGIKRYNKNTNDFTSYFGQNNKQTYISHIRVIKSYGDKSLFLGSDDGLYLFNTETHNVIRIDVPNLSTSLSDQNIYSILQDKEGGFWFGTYFGGVNYLNTSLVSIDTYHPDNYSKSLSGKAVSQFCEDTNGNFWIATEDGGVNFYNTTTKEFSQPIKTSYHNTHALLLDGQKLWIGTFSRGIDVYDLSTGQLKNYTNNIDDSTSLDDDCIFSLYKNKKGDIYIGTPVGLNVYNREKGKISRIEEVRGFVYDIKEDDQGDIWVALYGPGVLKRWDNRKKEWIQYEEHLSPDDPLMGSKIISIYIDNQKRVILTSENKGIFIHDAKTDTFENISEANGFPNNVVYGILDDHFGSYWASCNKGIVNFKLSTPDNYKLYTQADGLQSNQFNYKSSYKASDGKLYFGGINGFSCFYPQDLSSNNNTVVPTVKITGFKLLGNERTPSEEEILKHIKKEIPIKLSHKNSSFTISYVSLSYKSQSLNEYAYRLKGVDDKLNYVGNNKSVTYVNLSPGKYEFNVIGSNNDGIWNEMGSTLYIEIIPPIWKSMFAQILYLIIILGLGLVLILRLLKSNLQKQERILEGYKQEQETLAFKSKMDFFTTIAHEIRTPLSLINAPLEEIITSKDGNDATKENLNIIQRNCARLKTLINQLLDFRKIDSTTYITNPQEIKLKAYIDDLYLRFKKEAENKGITFTLENTLDPAYTMITDTDALTKIISNLITNALKYTKDAITLTASPHDLAVEITIADNGRGIANKDKPLIFDPFYQINNNDKETGYGIGLSLAKNLSEVLSAQLNVYDNPSGGSIFSLRFQELVSTYSGANSIEFKDSVRHTKESTLPIRILVVEDNIDLAKYIRKFLSNTYIVDLAKNTNEAYVMLDKYNYELIISDIMMPGEDGLSFTGKVKSDINYSHIPLILLSAKTESSVKIEGLHVGADVFIEKPFSPLYLKAQIGSLIENRKNILDAFKKTPLLPFSVLSSNEKDEEFLNILNDLIEDNISNPDFSVESLTEALAMSRSNLQRKLKGISDTTPGEYLRNYRLKRACILLLEADKRISEVAYEVGFTSASYFSKAFSKQFGMPPKDFIEKHNG